MDIPVLSTGYYASLCIEEGGNFEVHERACFKIVLSWDYNETFCALRPRANFVFNKINFFYKLQLSLKFVITFEFANTL